MLAGLLIFGAFIARVDAQVGTATLQGRAGAVEEIAAEMAQIKKKRDQDVQRYIKSLSSRFQSWDWSPPQSMGNCWVPTKPERAKETMLGFKASTIRLVIL